MEWVLETAFFQATPDGSSIPPQLGNVKSRCASGLGGLRHSKRVVLFYEEKQSCYYLGRWFIFSLEVKLKCFLAFHLMIMKMAK